MLTIKSITPKTENLSEIRALYEKSFPENERCPFAERLTEQQSPAEIVAM